jgi:DNA primase
MGFSEDDIRRVREATDLVALIGERVVLKPRNREYWGNCPFHHEKTPSFKVDPAAQLYHCFGCGESGDAITFVRKIDNLDFPDALRYLAERVNIELRESGSVQSGHRARLFKVMEKTVTFYHQQLMRVKAPANDNARTYLSKRGMGGQIARDWQLGYAPGHQMLTGELTTAGFSRADMLETNVAVTGKEGRLRDRFYERVIFPINDQQGRAIALGGRVLSASEPKYVNTSDTALFSKGTTLYALDRAKAQITATGTAIVVEGYTDTIAMHTAGFTNVVATLGTALTMDHVKKLARFARRLVYLFDGDAAGQRAADRAASLITRDIIPESGNRPVELLVAVLPASKDPADFLAEEDGGSAAMRDLLDNAEPLLRFTINRRLAAYNLKKPEQRQLALGESLRLLLPIRGSMLANDYLTYLADVLGVENEKVAANFAQIKASGQPSERQVTDAMETQQGTTQQHQSQGEAPSFADDMTGGLERELLASFVRYPQLRRMLAKAFRQIAWESDLHARLARLLIEGDGNTEPSQLAARSDTQPACPPAADDDNLPAQPPAADSDAAQLPSRLYDAEPSQLAARLYDAEPHSAGVLATVSVAIDPNDVEAARRHTLIVLYSLREQQLEREIRDKENRLKYQNLEGTPEYDQLFGEVVKAQHELRAARQRFTELSKTSP